MNDLELVKIERRIYSIRGVRVILDADLAVLYGVSTKRLNEQLRRNRKRFPDDFAFQLSAEETAALRSQNATSSSHGGRRYRPYAFTEHGALQAANIGHSRGRALASYPRCITAYPHGPARACSQQYERRPHERVRHSRFCKNARTARDQCRDPETPRRNRQVVTRARFRASRHIPETLAALVTPAQSASAADRVSSPEQITNNNTG
jgi:hypothetical protein